MWPINSSYWWQAKIVMAREEMLSLKTLKRNVEKIKKEIKKIHSYKLPVIIVEEISSNKSAVQWFKKVIN